MEEQIKKLIEVYEIQKKGYDSLLEKYNEIGLEELDFEGTENYGVFLGKSELLDDIINDLKELVK